MIHTNKQTAVLCLAEQAKEHEIKQHTNNVPQSAEPCSDNQPPLEKTFPTLQEQTQQETEGNAADSSEQQQPQVFRICAKKLYLTYSQVNKDMTSNDVIQQLKSKDSLPDFDYLVSRELHQDGGVHYHVLLAAEKKFDIKNANILDIQFLDENFHGNYKPVKHLAKVIAYICKQSDYVTSFENIIDGKLVTLKQTLMRSADAEGISKTLLDFCSSHTDKAFNSLGLINAQKFLEKKSFLEQEMQDEKVETPFRTTDFIMPPKLQDWVDNPVKTLVLTGPSGVGKTQFVLAFCKDKGLKPLFANNKQGLTRLKPQHNAIVLDDFDFGSFNEAELLAFTSTDVVKNLRVLYKEVRKKANLVQIIALNLKELRALGLLVQKRFSRRIDFVNLVTPFINPNVTINVNINCNQQVNNNNVIINKTVEQIQHEEDLHCEDTQSRIQEACDSWR